MESMNLSVKEMGLLIIAFFMGLCALMAPNFGGKEFALAGAGLGVISGGAFMIFLYLKLFPSNKKSTEE
jgi:hypothetical protein